MRNQRVSSRLGELVRQLDAGIKGFWHANERYGKLVLAE